MASWPLSALLHLWALDQPAEQVGASDSAGVGDLGCAGAHQPVDALGLGFGDDGGKRLLDPYRVGLVLGVGAPDQDICYPIDTKNSSTRGWWIWTPLKPIGGHSDG